MQFFPGRGKLQNDTVMVVTDFIVKLPKTFYRVAYFEAIDLAIAAIKNRFDLQPGYAMYRRLARGLAVEGCLRIGLQ